MMKQTAPQSEIALPVSSSEWRLPWIRSLGKLVTAMTLVLVIEYLWGHPAIRWQWYGTRSGYPESMHSCTLITILGERHESGDYRQILTFQKPYRTVGRRALDFIAHKL